MDSALLRKARFSFIGFLTVVLVLLFFVRIGVLYSTIDIAPSFIDESFWMHGTYFYHLFFQERDFFNKDWYNFISYDQPPLGKYILGFALHVSNHKVADTGGGLMNWLRYIANNWLEKRLSYLVSKYNLASDRKLLEHNHSLLEQTKNPIKATLFSREDYRVGRITVFIFAVIAAVLLIIIGTCVFKSLFAGMLAGVVFLSNGITIPVFQQIFVDSICCFFVLSALFILLRLFHELSIGEKLQKKVIALSVLEGLFLSFALSTKFITMYMAAAVVLVFIMSILFGRRVILRVGILILILASAFAFFVLLNPFLYPNPIGNTIKMAEYRHTIMKTQSRVQWPTIGSFSERIRVIYRDGILLRYNFHKLPEKILYLFVFIVGAGTLAKRSLNELSAGRFGSHTILLLWIAATFIVNGLLVNMQWDRYFIPFAMCTVLILALGAERIMNALTVVMTGEPTQIGK